MRISSVIPLLPLTCLIPPVAAQQPHVHWAAYGGDAGGSRYSALVDINRSNVARLAVAWTFRTGHTAIRTASDEPRFETTPIVVDGRLYLTTPLGELIALDPATGAERWRFDPQSRRAPTTATSPAGV